MPNYFVPAHKVPFRKAKFHAGRPASSLSLLLGKADHVLGLELEVRDAFIVPGPVTVAAQAYFLGVQSKDRELAAAQGT